MTTTNPTDRRHGKAAFKRLSPEDKDWVYWAVETGEPVPNRALAEVTVAYARHRLHLALVWGLPFSTGSAVAAGAVGYLVAKGSSAGFAFGFVLGLVGFVGYAWWHTTWRPRKRGLAANLALLGQAAPPPPKRKGESPSQHWMTAAPLAWITTMAISGVVHITVGGAEWVGLPVFVAALVLYRRLVARASESIDEWVERSTSPGEPDRSA